MAIYDVDKIRTGSQEFSLSQKQLDALEAGYLPVKPTGVLRAIGGFYLCPAFLCYTEEEFKNAIQDAFLIDEDKTLVVIIFEYVDFYNRDFYYQEMDELESEDEY